MSATTSSAPTAGGIWSSLGKKSTNNSNNKKSGAGFGGNNNNANDPDVLNLTSIKAAGIRGNGPAIQRIVVVGHCMSGKRSFIDRLRKASEPPLQESKQFHGKFGAQRAAKAATAADEKRAELGTAGPAPKTLAASTRGCGFQYTALAYQHNGVELDSVVQHIATLANDDQRPRSIVTAVGDIGSPLNANANKAGLANNNNAAGGGAVVTTTANSFHLSTASNCTVEVIAVDVVEALDAAIPTYESLQYTAVIVVLDAMDIANSSSAVTFWTNAINARVRTLTYLQQHGKNGGGANNTNMMGSTTNGAGANNNNATPNNKQGVSKSLKGPYAGIDLSSVDVRLLLDKRGEELATAKSVLKITDVKTRVVEMGKLHGAYVGAAGDAAPPIPESLRMLLPSMIVLSKVDLLEEACKATAAAAGNANNAAGADANKSVNPSSAAGENSAAGASAYGGYPIAVQHARWLALQRGSAFSAINNKDYSSFTSNFYQSLWIYIAYGLLPGQFETVEYLKQQRAQLSTRDGTMTTEEMEEESRREIEALDAKRKRKQQQQQQAAANNKRTDEDGNALEADETMADASIDGADLNTSININDASVTVTSPTNNGGDDSEDLDFRRRIMLETITSATLLDSAVRDIMNIAPTQHVFIPRGLDEALLIEKQTTSSAFVQVRFSALATTSGSETIKSSTAAAGNTTNSTTASASANGSPTFKDPNDGMGAASGNNNNNANAASELSAAEVTKRMFDQFASAMLTELNSSAAAAQRAAAAAGAASVGPSTGAAGSPNGGFGGDFGGAASAMGARNDTSGGGHSPAVGARIPTASVTSPTQDDDEAMIWDE